MFFASNPPDFKQAVKAIVYVGKFNDQTFHVVGRVSTRPPRFHAPLGGAPSSWESPVYNIHRVVAKVSQQPHVREASNNEDLFLVVTWKGPQSVTDLRIGQIGHGLGPRATLSYDDVILNKKICETAQRLNFTIYLETGGNANVCSRLLSVQEHHGSIEHLGVRGIQVVCMKAVTKKEKQKNGS